MNPGSLSWFFQQHDRILGDGGQRSRRRGTVSAHRFSAGKKLPPEGRFAAYAIDEADIGGSGSHPGKDDFHNSPDGSSKRFGVFDVGGSNTDVDEAERAGGKPIL